MENIIPNGNRWAYIFFTLLLALFSGTLNNSFSLDACLICLFYFRMLSFMYVVGVPLHSSLDISISLRGASVLRNVLLGYSGLLQDSLSTLKLPYLGAKVTKIMYRFVS